MPGIKHLLDHPNALQLLLLPETELEQALLAQPEFKQGMMWGEPRFGHPEGKVILHVREVLDNIDMIQEITPETRAQLRIIALAHDTFKYCEEKSKPRDWTKHHGMLARNFLARFITDPVLLDVVETHDDAYYAWRSSRRAPELDFDNEYRSLEDLLQRIGSNLQLYYLFFKCDTQTGDKTQASLKWFEKTVSGIDLVSIR